MRNIGLLATGWAHGPLNFPTSFPRLVRDKLSERYLMLGPEVPANASRFFVVGLRIAIWEVSRDFSATLRRREGCWRNRGDPAASGRKFRPDTVPRSSRNFVDEIFPLVPSNFHNSFTGRPRRRDSEEVRRYLSRRQLNRADPRSWEVLLLRGGNQKGQVVRSFAKLRDLQGRECNIFFVCKRACEREGWIE